VKLISPAHTRTLTQLLLFVKQTNLFAFSLSLFKPFHGNCLRFMIETTNSSWMHTSSNNRYTFTVQYRLL